MGEGGGTGGGRGSQALPGAVRGAGQTVGAGGAALGHPGGRRQPVGVQSAQGGAAGASDSAAAVASLGQRAAAATGAGTTALAGASLLPGAEPQRRATAGHLPDPAESAARWPSHARSLLRSFLWGSRPRSPQPVTSPLLQQMGKNHLPL